MYEAFYGLKSRPFSSTPDPRSFVDVGKTRDVVDSLANSLRDGQGFVILTAASGLGKTITGREVLQQLSNELHPVFLANSHFPTKRSLLQSILYELGQAYSGMTEQELRLELQSAARQLHRSGSGIILMLDEAHRLNPRLLEELRTIADWDEDGHALIRILLTGQLELEEQLGEPELEALRQRIRCQQILEPLTLAESHNYLSQRIEKCGATLNETFSEDAVRIICQASDGSPRCINQLADHSLLLGYMAEQRPVTSETVRSALEDLKQLPLHWNDVANLAPAQPTSADAEDDREDSESQSELSKSAQNLTSDSDLSAEATPSESEQEESPSSAGLKPVEQSCIEVDEQPSETVVFEFGADLDPEPEHHPGTQTEETTQLESATDESAQAAARPDEKPGDDPFDVPFDSQVRLGGAQVEFWDEFPELYGQRIVPLPPDIPESAQSVVDEQNLAASASDDPSQPTVEPSAADQQRNDDDHHHNDDREVGLEEVVVDPYARIDDGRPLSPQERRQLQESRLMATPSAATPPQSHQTHSMETADATQHETHSSAAEHSVPESIQVSADEEFGRGWSEPPNDPARAGVTEAENTEVLSDDSADSEADPSEQRSSTEYHYDHALDLINEMLPMVDEALNPSESDKPAETSAQLEPDSVTGSDTSARSQASSKAWAEAPIEDEETVEAHLQQNLMDACRELSDALQSLDLDADDPVDFFPKSTGAGQPETAMDHNASRQADRPASTLYDQVQSPEPRRSEQPARKSSEVGMQSLFTRLRKRIHD